jgi:hypothetical protein
MLLPRGLSRVELTHLISSQLADGIKVGAFDGEPAGLGARHDAKFRMPTRVSSVIRIRSGFYCNAPVGMIRAHVVPRARDQTLLITLSFVSLDPTRVNSLTDKKKVASAHFVFAIGSGHGAAGRPVSLPPSPCLTPVPSWICASGCLRKIERIVCWTGDGFRASRLADPDHCLGIVLLYRGCQRSGDMTLP